MSATTSSPSGTTGFAFRVIFRLVFVIAGVAVLGYSYQAYLGGQPFQQTAFMGALGVIFMGVGLSSLYTVWRARNKAPETVTDAAWPEAPWRVRPAWRNRTLTAKQGADRGTTLFAVVWNGIAWPAAFFAIYSEWQQGPGFDMAVLLILVFPLVGVVVAWMAVRGWLQQRKFGTTTLRMQTVPGRLGDSLSMILQTGVQQDKAPQEGFHVRLTCYRRSVRYTTDSDGDRRREVNKDVLWRDEKYVRGRSYGTKGRLEVPVTFEIPPDPPPSTPQKLEDRIMWEVDIDADVPGVDFDAAFEIPVFEPDSGATTRSDGGESGAENHDVPTTPPISEDALGQRVDADEKMDPYEQYELGESLTEPVSDGIAMDRSLGGGLQLHFAAGRNKKLGLLWTAIAVGTGGGALLLITQSFFGALILGLIAGFTGYAAWQTWTVSSTLTVERGTIRLVRGSFGRGEPVSFPCAELADVTLKANGHAGRTTFYDLRLHRIDGAGQQKAEAHAEQADRVAAFLRRSGLVGTDAQSDEALSQIKEAIHEQSATITVATSLSNKQEADWLATVIQQAAIKEEQFA